MMQSIMMSLNLLKEKLAKMEKDNLELVELCIVPEQVENENFYPSFLHFGGISKDGIYKDYESVDALSLSEQVDKSA